MKGVIYYNKKMISKNDIDNYNNIEEFISSNKIYNTTNDRSYKLGFEIFGVFLIGFCKWIHENITKEKINNIFFLARDGYIVKEVYDKLYPNENTKYLYISRKSLVLPSIKSYNTNEIIDSLILPPSFKIDDILSLLNIDIDKVKSKINKYDLNKIYYRKKLNEYNDIKKLIDDLKDIIIKNIKEQEDYFTKYLKDEEFKDKVAIIDIGWHNSIQNYFIKINDKFKLNTRIFGYYVGVYDNAKKVKEPHKAKGYLYEYYKDNDLQYKTFSFVSLLESMFLKNEGTTLSYKKINNQIKPVIDSNNIENKIIESFQKGAIDFVDYFINKKIDINIINKNIAMNNLIEFGLNPKKEDIKLFGNMIFENFSYNSLINFNKSNLYYYTHLKQAKLDFYKSGWRIVFLKKLIPIKFPHFLIFKILCKMFL